MKTAIVTAKIEPKIKAAAERAAHDLGVSLSFVINQSLREFAITKKIELIPNAITARTIQQAEHDSKAGRLHGPAHSIKELRKRLGNL